MLCADLCRLSKLFYTGDWLKGQAEGISTTGGNSIFHPVANEYTVLFQCEHQFRFAQSFREHKMGIFFYDHYAVVGGARK